MTDRDPAPQLPSCPTCGENDRVERERVGGRLAYSCGRDWTVFDGSADEWTRMSKTREMYQNHRKNLEVAE